MLSKFRTRPERRVQAVPLKVFRERHGLQARREHDACTTERMPFPCSAEGSAAPLEDDRVSRVLRHGAFSNCVGAASLTRLRVPLRDASDSAAELPDEATHGEPGHDG